MMSGPRLQTARRCGSPCGGAEVNTAGELAHHEQIHNLDDLALQRRCRGERGKQFYRSKVGEQAKLLAQAQERSFRPNRILETVPLGAAHGAEQHRVALFGQIEHRIGERLTVRVDRCAADDLLFQLHAESRKASLLGQASEFLRPSPPGRCHLRVVPRFYSSWSFLLHHLEIVFPSCQFVQRINIGERAGHDNVGVGALA
jgi:hypothetical protein